MTHDTITIRDLPGIMQEWARLTDVPTVLKVLQEWGGTKRSIPTSIGKRSPLVVLIGAKHARAIVDAFGCCRIDIPVPPRPSLKSKVMAFPPDTPTRDIAASLKCTERYVRMIRRDAGIVVSPPPRRPALKESVAHKVLAMPSDMTAEQIADALDCSSSYVRRLRATPRATPLVADKILAMPCHMPVDEVARAVGCNRDYVREVRRNERMEPGASASPRKHGRHYRF